MRMHAQRFRIITPPAACKREASQTTLVRSWPCQLQCPNTYFLKSRPRCSLCPFIHLKWGATPGSEPDGGSRLGRSLLQQHQHASGRPTVSGTGRCCELSRQRQNRHQQLLDRCARVPTVNQMSCNLAPVPDITVWTSAAMRHPFRWQAQQLQCSLELGR